MLAGITSKWVDTDLVFYNAAGTEIARFDNSEGTLDIDTLAIDGTTVTATATEINKLASAGAAVASGTQAAVIADIATDANGTAISVAVNALIDAAQAFGIVAAS